MANDINSVAMSFTDILMKNYKKQLLENDLPAILIDMLASEDVFREIIEIFYHSEDFLQFFIFYFKNILSNGVEFSLAQVFSTIENGNYSPFGDLCFKGDYKFEEKLELSANYFKGVENIPPYAFFGWYGLDKVTLSNDVKIIDSKAFYLSTGLTSIEIPNSVTSIGESAFRNCRSLRSITIPESVTSIGNIAFQNCDWLESVVILGRLRSIPKWVFVSCLRLTNVVMPKYIQVIGDWAFEGCKSLKTIVLPDGLKRIGDGAFEDCENLTNLVIPDKVKKIGDQAFVHCHSLTSIRLPSKLEEIGPNIFGECYNTLNDVSYNGTKEQWQQIDKSRYWFTNWASSDNPKQIKCTDGIIETKGEDDYVV